MLLVRLHFSCYLPLRLCCSPHCTTQHWLTHLVISSYLFFIRWLSPLICSCQIIPCYFLRLFSTMNSYVMWSALLADANFLFLSSGQIVHIHNIISNTPYIHIRACKQLYTFYNTTQHFKYNMILHTQCFTIHHVNSIAVPRSTMTANNQDPIITVLCVPWVGTPTPYCWEHS